ncbi:hypothetical protein BS47DRAFT_1388274 [Hydnum rufescens UP504]|uniref:Uncharacterized protein n=1 Tax=Hydnum rufescens UP504 TaxID=1448309 RepID=A0A9P6E1U7_9AGAM|nr:hypothetical protein BS47DRAFT_1388274 [Hydnum rufescens UP504]
MLCQSLGYTTIASVPRKTPLASVSTDLRHQLVPSSLALHREIHKRGKSTNLHHLQAPPPGLGAQNCPRLQVVTVHQLIGRNPGRTPGRRRLDLGRERYEGAPRWLRSGTCSGPAMQWRWQRHRRRERCIALATITAVSKVQMNAPSAKKPSAPKHAGVIVGLNVLSVINEPTSLDKNICEEGVFECKHENGKLALVLMFLSSTNVRSLHRLRVAWERSEYTLPSAAQTLIDIDSHFEGIDSPPSALKQLFGNLFRDNPKPVEKVPGDAKIDKSNMCEIVLDVINPNGAVAYDAAAQASTLCLGNDSRSPAS